MTSGPETPQSRREARQGESQEITELPTRRRASTGDATATTRLPVGGADSNAGIDAATTSIPAGAPEPAFRQDRSIRPLPIALAAIGVVLAIVLALVVVGVAGKSAPTPVAAPSETPISTPAAPAEASAAPVTQAPVVQPPREASGPNECADATGEGGSVDLDAVALSLEKGDLLARFQLAAELPAGAASLGIFAESKDGKRSYQLAATWNDGSVDKFFVHDFQRGKDTKLDGRDLEVDGTEITAAFPAEVASNLGSGWRWYAFSTADGKDVDACPGDPLSFDTMTFDSDSGK